MERVLLKLAQQLNQYDENSIMALWNDYAGKVKNFEPSARWEESALVFCMIQAMHWKNQLFNAELAASARRGRNPHSKSLDKSLKEELASLSAKPPKKNAPGQAPANAKENSAGSKKGCKVLVFRPALPGQP